MWFLTVARPWGVPVRLHASLPVGMLLLSGFRIVPGFWVGLFVLVLLHEIGHALLVRRARLSLLSIDVHGFGGMCRYTGAPGPRDRALIAWGGVLAQAVLFGVVVVLTRLYPLPPSAFVLDLVDAWTGTNLLLMAVNLLPLPPLDGAEAWGLLRFLRFPRLRGRRRRRSDEEIDREVKDILRRTERDAQDRRLQ